MCQCGCAQLLGECDHVGCPSRDKELGELSADMAAGLTDQQILDDFRRQVRYDGAGRASDHRLQPGRVDRALCRICRGAAGHHPSDPALGRTARLQTATGKRGWTATALDPAERERREKIRRETDGGSGPMDATMEDLHDD